MGDLMEHGATWLASQHAGRYSRAVTYRRGDANVSIQAALGRTVFQVDTAFGVERNESRDYLVKASDLVLSDTVTLPQAGDTITETDGQTTYTYEVNAPGQEAVYSTDSYRKLLRIHTKLIGRG